MEQSFSSRLLPERPATQAAFSQLSFHSFHAKKSLPTPALAYECSNIANISMSNSTASSLGMGTTVKQERDDFYDSSSPDATPCKRKFSPNNLSVSGNPPVAARRNERERNRVKQVNMGFSTLRQRVPDGVKNKKMSKVETLRSAVEYIKKLQKMLSER